MTKEILTDEHIRQDVLGNEVKKASANDNQTLIWVMPIIAVAILAGVLVSWILGVLIGLLIIVPIVLYFKQNKADNDVIFEVEHDGELIVEILMAAPFVKDADIRLILQPMSRAEVLRAYLASEGFSVLAERYSVAAGRAYLALAVAYTGVPYEIDPVRAVLGDPTLRAPEDAAAYSAYLDAREREALCRLRGKTDGGISTAAEDALLLAIKQEREGLL